MVTSRSFPTAAVNIHRLERFYTLLFHLVPYTPSKMRLLASLLAALSLASTQVLADVSVFGVPAIIKPGQPFNASFQNAIEQPAQYTMVWGYTPYDDTTPPAYMPQHNTVGLPIATVYYPGVYIPPPLTLGSALTRASPLPGC